MGKRRRNRASNPAPSSATDPANGTSIDKSIADKRRAFQLLHQSGCFVIPNPWDAGSARYLESLNFKALATTSAGFAWSQGLSDGAITRDMAIDHLYELCSATGLPVNADFQ